MQVATILLVLQAAVAPQASAQGATVPGTGSPAFTIPRIERDSIVVDGVLEDAAWSRATRLTGFSQYEPADSRPADQATEVLVLYDARSIYFGIIAHTRPGQNVNATLARRDNILNDDRVLIYLDTFNDRRRAFVFGVNPFGIQLDGVRNEGSGTAGRMFGGGDDWSPDYSFESRGHIEQGKFIVEVRIPFKSLRFNSSGPQSWGINFSRLSPSANTEDTWTDSKRASASFLAQAGTMRGIEKVERGMVTEWQPFVTSSLNGARNGANGVFEYDNIKPDAGVNLRLGFPAISLDATVNPDFSQVESDVGLVTANERFSLFIPEKRPFFLEGIELFSTPNQLVYTRQIVSPLAGAKLTGKVGRLALAHLTALDDQPGDDALFNVSRVRTDFGGNSLAGITLSDRRTGATSNSVLAMDSRIVFAKLYYFESQLGQSWTRGGGSTVSSPMYSATFDRTGQLWGFHYSLTGFGEDFRTDAGFVPRSNGVSARAFNRLAFYGRSEKDPIQSVWIFAGPSRFWRYKDFGSHAPLEGDESIRLTTNLRGGWKVNGSAMRSFFSIDTSLFANVSVPLPGGSLTPYRPTGKLDNLWTQSIEVGTPVLRSINATVTLAAGGVAIFAEGAEGRSSRVDFNLGYRPTPGIRVEAIGALSRITRESDGSEFSRTFIPRLKLEYQPARALFFRLVSEYRDERRSGLRDAGGANPLYVDGLLSAPTRERRLRSDWLVSFEPNPGTVAFFGYGNTLERPETSGLGKLRRAVDGFFVKLAYQFRS